MKKMNLFLMQTLIVVGLFFAVSCGGDDLPAPKTVTVGAQSGTLTAGTVGNVIFPVATTNIANGTYPTIVANLPIGVSVSSNVTISDDAGILTLAGSTATLAGSYTNLTLTIDGTTSPAFMLKVNFAVGMSYGGGKVAYVDATGMHGLIAASADLTSGTTTTFQWGGYGTATGATLTDVGTGQANTAKIVQVLGAGSYAAKLCVDYRGGGYNDWFLPSRDELNVLYQNKTLIGGFIDDYYWSSSERDINNAWYRRLSNGYFDYYDKITTYRVRAVRVF